MRLFLAWVMVVSAIWLLAFVLLSQSPLARSRFAPLLAGLMLLAQFYLFFRHATRGWVA
jgi:hypothetical protein